MRYTGKTILTYEEWWAYEGKRRRERPYTPETRMNVTRQCKQHGGRGCPCPYMAQYDKVTIQRLPYEG